MITIQKKYHFYAAHRNQNLPDSKCSNIHGHTYYVDAIFQMDEEKTEAGITMLFEDIDKRVEPIIKEFDHCLLMDISDPLYSLLISMRIKIFGLDHPTSVENLAQTLFNTIKNIARLPITKIILQETTSSIIIYEP